MGLLHRLVRDVDPGGADPHQINQKTVRRYFYADSYTGKYGNHGSEERFRRAADPEGLGGVRGDAAAEGL